MSNRKWDTSTARRLADSAWEALCNGLLLAAEILYYRALLTASGETECANTQKRWRGLRCELTLRRRMEVGVGDGQIFHDNDYLGVTTYLKEDGSGCDDTERVYCLSCLPFRLDDDDVTPILAWEQLRFPPKCQECGRVLDYMCVFPEAHRSIPKEQTD